jgi:hypothetical protein
MLNTENIVYLIFTLDRCGTFQPIWRIDYDDSRQKRKFENTL